MFSPFSYELLTAEQLTRIHAAACTPVWHEFLELTTIKRVDSVDMNMDTGDCTIVYYADKSVQPNATDIRIYVTNIVVRRCL